MNRRESISPAPPRGSFEGRLLWLEKCLGLRRKVGHVSLADVSIATHEAMPTVAHNQTPAYRAAGQHLADILREPDMPFDDPRVRTAIATHQSALDQRAAELR